MYCDQIAMYPQLKPKIHNLQYIGCETRWANTWFNFGKSVSYIFICILVSSSLCIIRPGAQKMGLRHFVHRLGEGGTAMMS